MPKMKTLKAASKRFKLTSSGLLVRKKAGTTHFLAKKTSKRKRALRQTVAIDVTDQHRVKRCLGLA